MSELLQEIKQSKPFAEFEEEVFLNLQRTAYVVRQEQEALLKSNGLTFQQYNVLRILRGAGNSGLACSEIGDRLITRDSDLTRLLDRLAKNKLISVEQSKSDKRVKVSRISKKGSVLLAGLDEPIRLASKSQLQHLGPDLLEQFNALLVLARKKQS